MSFIQPCFIRTNTSRLRKKLEELGYKYEGCSKNNYAPYLFCDNDGKYHGMLFVPSQDDTIIDCSRNEKLFLALAAMRDDSDYMQWFTNSIIWFHYQSKTSFSVGSPLCVSRSYHKASVNELIDKFKTNENGKY